MHVSFTSCLSSVKWIVINSFISFSVGLCLCILNCVKTSSSSSEVVNQWWSSESNPQLLLFTGLYMEYCQFINIEYLFNIFIYLKYKNELLDIVVKE